MPDVPSFTIRILRPDAAAVLNRVAPGVFDHEVDPRWTAEFLIDARHHLAVALDGASVVGMASAVHHIHPGKPHGGPAPVCGGGRSGSA